MDSKVENAKDGYRQINDRLKNCTVDRLLEMKMASSEMEYGPRIDAINSYLDESIQEISDVIAAMPSRAQLPWKALNDMFIRLVREYAP